MKDWVNKIHYIDALEGVKKMPDNSVDLVFTDPPYNEKYKYRNSEYIDYREDYYEYIENIIIEIKRVLKGSGSLYLKHSSRQINKILPLISKHLIFRNLIMWISNSQAHPKANYDSYYEPIYFCTKTNDYTFNKKAELRKEPPGYWSGEGTEFVGLLTNCWYDIKKIQAGCLAPEGEVKNKEKIHPCSMPIRLAQRAIRVSSNEGDIVLDPFVGSGTTCIAAKIENRKYIGIDLYYKDMADRRLHNEVGLL